MKNYNNEKYIFLFFFCIDFKLSKKNITSKNVNIFPENEWFTFGRSPGR